MKGDPKILQLLNKVLRKELTGINQYFIHSRMCKNWGYHDIAKNIYHESVDEMKHADKIIERILFLEGAPSMSEYDKIVIGRNVKEQFINDLALEQAALAVLNPGIALCLEKQDHATRELLEDIVVDEEHHVDWLETQLYQIKEIGYENYLAEHLHPHES